MNARKSSRLLWVAIGVALGLAGLWQFFPLADASARLDRLPEKGLFFDSRPMPLSAAEREIFGAARVEKRLLRVRGRAYALTVVDGTRNRHAIHDPAYCFRGAGWEIRAGADIGLPHGETRAVSLRQGAREAEALYWFSDGRQAFASATRYWLLTTLRRLTLGRSGAEPVLVILIPVDERAPDWNTVIAVCPELTQL
ncbi:MAG: exosortase-associated EpsI family protein [Opitutaceae bacterium]|nr:exosortase-associated EpsI family protein [Opitutaceae bacterium]